MSDDIKTKLTIPYTQARLTPSVDFAGFIYPQVLAMGTLGKIVTTSALLASLQSTVSKTLGQTGVLIGGITAFDKNFSKEIYQRKSLGDYETIQNVPGKVSVSLTLNKVVFYKDSNLLDSVLDFNYNGAIKQSAPLMILEMLETPKSGDINIIMYLDCWFKSESVKYSLQDKTLVVSNLNVECARTFGAIDAKDETLNLGINAIPGISGITNSISNAGANFPLNLQI
jgi:hypothetical protein